MLALTMNELLLILCVVHLYVPTIYALIARVVQYRARYTINIKPKLQNRRDKRTVMLFELIAQNNKLSQQLAMMKDRIDELNTVSALYKHFETRIEKQSTSPRRHEINPLCGGDVSAGGCAGVGAISTPRNLFGRKGKTPDTAEICQDLFGLVDDELIFDISQRTSESSGSSNH